MFIDIDKKQEEKKIETHWISESGSINFFVIIGGKSPKSFYLEYSKLVGFPHFPPLFSIGYHQCKWNYKNEKEVLEIDSRFDELGCPLDVK